MIMMAMTTRSSIRVKARGGRATILGCMESTLCRVNKFAQCFRWRVEELKGLKVACIAALTLQRFNRSHPFLHLLGERTLRAIGIVLHTKIFINLEQTLLMRDGSQKLLPARIISKKTGRTGFESSIG